MFGLVPPMVYNGCIRNDESFFMAEWWLEQMQKFDTFLGSVSGNPDYKKPAPESERGTLSFENRIVRDRYRDTMRGHRIEVSCPGGKVSVVDRSRTGGGGREYHGSVEFLEYETEVKVSCKATDDIVRIRIERVIVLFPKDVTIVYNVPKDSKNRYGIGETLRDHEEAHVKTGLALRNPAFVDDLFRGRLSYTSPVTGETVKFSGLSVPAEFVSSALAFAKGKPMQRALDEAGTRIVETVGRAAIDYLTNVLGYIDYAENHGPPLPDDPRITPYRLVADKLALLPPPEPMAIKLAF